MRVFLHLNIVYIKTLLILFYYSLTITALPEPAAFIQQHPHQVGFVIPPNPSPPYGKSLPPSHHSSTSLRTWEWSHWLTDAKSVFKSLFGKADKSSQHHYSGNPDEEERNVGRFDNDIVLRVNVSSLADRITITELAEV
jgi:hypothetical protein